MQRKYLISILPNCKLNLNHKILKSWNKLLKLQSVLGAQGLMSSATEAHRSIKIGIRLSAENGWIEIQPMGRLSVMGFALFFIRYLVPESADS